MHQRRSLRPYEGRGEVRNLRTAALASLIGLAVYTLVCLVLAHPTKDGAILAMLLSFMLSLAVNRPDPTP